MATRMQQRRGTAADWAALNPVLSDGEIGFERDTGVFKIGDSVTPWSGLPVPFLTKALIDAKGDLIAGSADNTAVRVPVGANGTILVADSTKAAGMAWAAGLTALVISSASSRNAIGAAGALSGTVLAVSPGSGDGAATVPLAVRGMAGQTGDLQEWQSNTGAVLASVDSGGSFHVGAAIAASISAQASAANRTALIARGFAAQTADLVQVQDSNAAVLIRVGSAGLLEAKQGLQSTSPAAATVPLIVKAFAGQTAALQQWQDSGGGIVATMGAFGGLSLGSGAPTNARLGVITGSAATVGLIVRAVSAQTADIQEWQDGTGTIQTRIDPTGDLLLPGARSAPRGRIGGTDAYLNASGPTVASTTTFSLAPAPFADVSATIAANRRIKLTLTVSWNNNAGNTLGNSATFRLVDGGGSAPTVSSTSVAEWRAPQPAGTGPATTTFTTTINTFAAGVHRFALLWRSIGGGTVQLFDAFDPTMLAIEDLGPAT